MDNSPSKETLELLSEYLRMRFGLSENEPSLERSKEIYDKLSSDNYDEEFLVKEMFPKTYGTCKYGVKLNLDLRRVLVNLRNITLR